jgi:curli biogenesis system outer membrane secretion channel CsgG
MMRGRAARYSLCTIGICLSLWSCTSPSQNLPLIEGPAISDVVTPFDYALACLGGKVDARFGFAVGNIPDGTGREAYNGTGTGKFVTQSAGDIVQSALWKTGVKVINRRDVGSTALEANWGLRDLKKQLPAHFAITGSINSLDFIPGGGAYINVGGVGARYRQNRILVGLDLAMTNIATGQIVANIALLKQMVADEAGVFGSAYVNSKILDNKIIDAEIGGLRREALNNALRSMLQLATYELMVQLMPPSKYEECSSLIDPRYGQITGMKTAGQQSAEYHKELNEKKADEGSVQLGSSNDGAHKSAGKALDNKKEGTYSSGKENTAQEVDSLKADEGGASYTTDNKSSEDDRIFQPKRNMALPSHTTAVGSSW